jgi:radical SAM superfamily enzyme YgiQ (UPF0313 family)
MQIETITCIQLDGELPDYAHRLVMPDYGLPVIGTILSQAGYEVTIFIEHIQPPDWERIAQSDLVCFSSLNAAAGKTYALADRIKSELGIPVVMGGTHATYFPESCLQHCDYVVLGEGDETILDLTDALSRNRDVSDVPGIAFKRDGVIHFTEHRAGPETFDTIPDFELISGYPRITGLSVWLKRRRPLLTLQSSRGCPYNCAFCIVNTMFCSGYRKRSIDSVIADMRDKRKYGTELMFVDNEFCARPVYTKQLLRRIIEEDLGYNITVFARVEVVKDDEMLSLMRAAGVSRIYQGFESIHPDTLKAYDKQQGVEQIVAAIEKLHAYGFNILGSFCIGADTDTLETVRSTVDFSLEHRLESVYFWPIWGLFPEKRHDYQTIVPWYRGIFRGWAHTDGHYATHFPMQMRPSQYQKALVEAYDTVYGFREIFRCLTERRYEAAKAKALLNYAWGFIRSHCVEYVSFLKEIEDGLYDENDRLMEDRLIERVRRDPQWTFQVGNRSLEARGISPLELPVPGERNITCRPPNLEPTGAHA